MEAFYLDIVEACVQILNKYESLFILALLYGKNKSDLSSEGRTNPPNKELSGLADGFTLTCMFVYCKSEECQDHSLRFVSYCCTKSRSLSKLKTFFP